MLSLEANEGQEIFDWARRCEELFRKLLSTLVGHGGIGTHYRTVRDYCQRFELWAGFIGVFADGSVSLDNRLRFYPEVRDLVLRMLKLLERNLSHGFWFDSASREDIIHKASPIVASETSTSLAAAAALDAIQEAIDRLRRLAVLIRKSPSSSLTSRVEAFARRAGPAKVKEFQKITSLFVTGRLPGIGSGLATQLVSSISFRRLRLLYQSKHNEKLKARRVQTISAPSQLETETRREEGPAPVLEDLSRLDVLRREAPPARPLQQPTYTETENSGLNYEDFQRYDGSPTDVSDTSTITSIGHGYSYPPRPKPEKGDQYCACNWCSDEIKVSDLNIPGWWRAHFKKDLQPYVCISEDCSEPAVYFTSFSKWRKHMEGVHTTKWARRIHSPQVWYCDVSPHKYLEFEERGELEHHLENEHFNDLNPKQLQRRLARNVLPSRRRKNMCPLCNQDILKVYELQEHLRSEDVTTPQKAPDQKAQPSKGPRVRFQDVEDFSSSDEETSNDITDDISLLNADEKNKLDLGKVSRHIAGHLKSLAFLSIRYLDHDAVAGEGDSGRAASGGDCDDIEGSNRTDKATERILDDFPEAAYSKLEFEDTRAERTDSEEDGFEDALRVDGGEIDTPSEGETENSNSLEEEERTEEKCRQLFCLTSGSRYELYKDQVETRAEGTCQWFLRHERYKWWLEQDSGVLLVTADPGCGKSVLVKHLIDEALPRSATICYFFFKDQDQNTLRQALCALLHQLFCYQPSLVRHAISEYAKYGQDLVGLASSLCDILKNAAQDPVTGPLIIVLDALDECAESDLRDLFQTPKRLYSLNGPGPSKMKFLLTGRPHPTVSVYDRLAPESWDLGSWESVSQEFSVPRIHLSGEESNTDRDEINHLIQHRVEQLTTDRKLPKEIKDCLAERLLDVPNPTYLWVHLVFEYLRTFDVEGAVKEIETTIASLPESINEAYEQMLSKSKDHLMVRKALNIISAACRPLTLSEMNVAINLNKQFNSISNIELEEEEDFKSHFKEFFGLFVSIRRGKIDLFHPTAREFLHAKSLSSATIPSKLHWQHSITIQDAHTILAELCILYLNLFNSNASLLLDTNGEAGHAFLSYSAQNWGTHFYEVRIGSNESGIVPMALKICDLGSNAYLVWSKIFEANYHHPPLLWAALKGYEPVVRLLLGQGANFELSDTILGRTPLSWAAENGHEAVVQLLLKRDAYSKSRDKDCRTPLSWAAENGHTAVVQLLLDQGANLELGDKDFRTPLSWAAGNGHVAVVQLLLDRGVDLESRDEDRRTPLWWAAVNGHAAVVRLLLDRGADLKSEDFFGNTPLLVAKRKEHEGVVRLLLSQ
ncbi:hypothetical protein F5B21DRAFT_505895 [Xylaria acuta]|nr:hypothetical protein F5B21DRAFT_505895 [Xylaria acuta]